MKKDIEEIIQCYDRFLEILEQITMSAEEQISKLKGTAVADEIALDFSEIGMMYAKELLKYKWINKEQFLIAKSIDENLDNMSQKKELWSENALLNSKEWDECRKKGRKLLSTLE